MVVGSPPRVEAVLDALRAVPELHTAESEAAFDETATRAWIDSKAADGADDGSEPDVHSSAYATPRRQQHSRRCPPMMDAQSDGNCACVGEWCVACFMLGFILVRIYMFYFIAYIIISMCFSAVLQ